ncbi:hypothetical protein HPB49_022649 [Dermacentor silvarum]|uniref:Uncharacterized protein n=1 Tax=Dermacentor silvarum TaxID=543639 RepID=A0ACB8CT61_DERSI|nr:hypothetical protein HPB49_022649 [Dermacentor silvarum]
MCSEIVPVNPSSHCRAYDPAEFDSLAVSADIKELFGFITRYTPQTVELDQELRPFVPELIPAVGDIDAFLKVPRPDGRADSVQLGLRVLDEPSAQQSEPSILALRLRALSRDARLAAASKAVVKSVERPEDQPREIESWLQSVQELHRARPPPTVHYTRNMPDVESLMQEWPADFEEMLAEVQVPTAELECSLEEYATMACLLMDIPVYKGKLIQSLHVLFSLFTAFKNSQRRYGDRPHLLYVDAAKTPYRSVYSEQDYSAAHTVSVVDSNLVEVTSASFRNTTMAASEETVITLTMAARPNQDSVINFSDSPEACRSHVRGHGALLFRLSHPPQRTPPNTHFGAMAMDTVGGGAGKAVTEVADAEGVDRLVL